MKLQKKAQDNFTLFLFYLLVVTFMAAVSEAKLGRNAVHDELTEQVDYISQRIVKPQYFYESNADIDESRRRLKRTLKSKKSKVPKTKMYKSLKKKKYTESSVVLPINDNEISVSSDLLQVDGLPIMPSNESKTPTPSGALQVDEPIVVPSEFPTLSPSPSMTPSAAPSLTFVLDECSTYEYYW